MNVFNVHVNRYPVNGIVRYVHYNAGQVPATPRRRSRASRTSRRRSGIETRLEPRARAADRGTDRAPHRDRLARSASTCSRASAWGSIRFGSRVDVFLPLSAVASRQGRRRHVRRHHRARRAERPMIAMRRGSGDADLAGRASRRRADAERVHARQPLLRHLRDRPRRPRRVLARAGVHRPRRHRRRARRTRRARDGHRQPVRRGARLARRRDLVRLRAGDHHVLRACSSRRHWEWLFVLHLHGVRRDAPRALQRRAGGSHEDVLPRPAESRPPASRSRRTTGSARRRSTTRPSFSSRTATLSDLPWHVILRGLMAVLAALMISNVPYPTVPSIGWRTPRKLLGSIVVLGVRRAARRPPRGVHLPRAARVRAVRRSRAARRSACSAASGSPDEIYGDETSNRRRSRRGRSRLARRRASTPPACRQRASTAVDDGRDDDRSSVADDAGGDAQIAARAGDAERGAQRGNRPPGSPPPNPSQPTSPPDSPRGQPE